MQTINQRKVHRIPLGKQCLWLTLRAILMKTKTVRWALEDEAQCIAFQLPDYSLRNACDCIMNRIYARCTLLAQNLKYHNQQCGFNIQNNFECINLQPEPRDSPSRLWTSRRCLNWLSSICLPEFGTHSRAKSMSAQINRWFLLTKSTWCISASCTVLYRFRLFVCLYALHRRVFTLRAFFNA